MSSTPPTSTAVTGLVLIALLLTAGIVCLIAGQLDAGNSLMSLAVGIVVGGGGVHLASKNGNGGG